MALMAALLHLVFDLLAIRLHGKRMLVHDFVQNGALLQILDANRSQSERNMKNLKDLFCLMTKDTLYSTFTLCLDKNL